jgi:hypothetical protein
MDMGPSELVGRSCYQFVHGQDATRIRQSHLDREAHFCTLSPSSYHHKNTNDPASLFPGSPSSGLTRVSGCTAASGGCSEQKSNKEAEQWLGVGDEGQ